MFSRNLPAHTGQDPRPWSEYTHLRDELNKLTHPARPDVDWQKVEQLCLTLFRHNGADLQTTAWFCCARLQRAGLSGLQEGLELLDSLISHQWSIMWPPQTAFRREILAWLSDHLILNLRRFTLSHQELPVIYRLEQQFRHLCDVLQRLELRQASKMDALLHWMHAAVVRLENAREPRQADNASAASFTHHLPPDSTVQQPATGEPVVLVFRDDIPLSAGRSSIRSHYHRAVWSGFTGGVIVTLLVMVAGISGWQSWQKHQPKALLSGSLSPLPSPLTPAEQTVMINTHAAVLQSQGQSLLSQTRKQLDTVIALTPGWDVHYGFALVAQAQRLWPHHPETSALVTHWQQQIESTALPTGRLEGWHQAMSQLQSLMAKLNRTDTQRGRYLTVSELKSEVFAITQTMSQSPPLEEQLRQLSLQQKAMHGKLQTELQTTQYLRQLINRYMLIRLKEAEQ
ncbi:VasL domain-containing protein [Enterobacter kobei]|uniref:VasL domain-containing protein n=1 Tax=Enterobacter kobei TaxID=208224 RepID=UPI002FD511AC